MTIVDAAERADALDTNRSFCVSAPAGSGKTELLIQRYLSLLPRVSRPEQILAVTFTRKAAAEMRERVLSALREARLDTPCENPHEQVTRDIAKQALVADERGDWQLLRDISRLNIRTIDGFCASLVRQMPVLSRLGGQVSAQDNAQPLYVEAVSELFAQVETSHPVADDLAALMLHFDNNWERLQELLISMLAQRQQWRAYMGVHHEPEEAQSYLRGAVALVVQEALDEVRKLLSGYEDELWELQLFAARNLDLDLAEKFPGSSPADIPAWRVLINTLLTQKNEWRKSVTKREGFPAGKGEATERKQKFLAIFNELQQIEGLLDHLQIARSLPEANADSESWQLVLHLSRLLPLLSAALLVVFQRHGVVDHSQMAEAALLALGDDDTPTDLALRLDYGIEHILVDEFQDTSVNQFELVEKLTRGWGEHNANAPDNPRTLMIVGDGMQSIYGFRGANVGLLLRAQLQGFNGVALHALKLRSNFRSDEGVVNWVNDTFVQAFPAQDNINRAQIRYSAATAVRPAQAKRAVQLEIFTGEDTLQREISYVCEDIERFIAESDAGTLAVLGRSRGHLQGIIDVLKQRGVPHNAQDLDSLENSPVVVDLLTLCRVLANPADRLAWMSLLRAPWCGLKLADLMVLSRFVQEAPHFSLWNIFTATQWQGAISKDGLERLQKIRGPLRHAHDSTERLALRVWIEQLWLALEGPACAPDALALQDAESFFQLLEEADTEGVGLNVDWLLQKLEKRFMSGGDPDSRVQLMTLHKAKGLEFDRVIIPQLNRATRSDSRQVLLWDERSSASAQRLFLLAADDHSEPDVPTLYNFLRVERKYKSQLESTRLLYVGATRAISGLLLTASLNWDNKKESVAAPSPNSLLNSIWGGVKEQMRVHQPMPGAPVRVHTLGGRLLRRLATSIATQESEQPVVEGRDTDLNIPQFPGNHTDRSIGTVVHLAMQELALMDNLPAEPSAEQIERWHVALQSEGVFGEHLDSALQAVLTSVRKTLESEQGRWLLSNKHNDVRSEWPLTMRDADGFPCDIIIDRSFIDVQTGERWIVDYKNSQPATESLEEFLAHESATYHGQLSRYRDAVGNLGAEPIRCALFFTALGKLHPVAELDSSVREGD